jgi:hypothetical protein
MQVAAAHSEAAGKVVRNQLRQLGIAGSDRK